MPAAVVANEPEVALPALSELVDVKTGVPVQVVSPGGKSAKVTVPVGLLPPLTDAVSLIAVPTTPPAEGAVAIAGTAFGRLLVNVHARGWAAWPVKLAVVPVTVVVTALPA